MVRVENVLDSWKLIRQDTAGAVEEIPVDEFGFRPTQELATFGEIARHILDAGDGLTGVLMAGETDFSTPDFRPRLKAHLRPVPAGAAGAELAAALRQSVAERTAQLAGMPPEFFTQIVKRFDGVEVTRLEMLQQIKEHELTHRQQLFMYLRLKGMVPATTRRRLAKMAGK